MPDYEIGSDVLSGWRITRLIGEGGFGKVYEVEKSGHGISAKSALKVVTIPPSDSMVREALAQGMDRTSVAAYFTSIVDDFSGEVALLSQMAHPGIVSYQDHDFCKHEDGIGWDVLLRMELLQPLSSVMEAGVLDRDEIVCLGMELADALAYCHSLKLVHRDVKPGNVFIDRMGRYKLGDFGIARTAEHTMGALSRKGTELYMAPELYTGGTYGASVDVYALGLMLYQLLNRNRLPFLPPAPEPITFHDREQAIARRLAGSPFHRPVDCDDALFRIISRACAFDPSQRPSAVELRNLLMGVLSSDDGAHEEPADKEPVSEARPETTYAGQEAPAVAAPVEQGTPPVAEGTRTTGIWDSFGEAGDDLAEGADTSPASRRWEADPSRVQERDRGAQGIPASATFVSPDVTRGATEAPAPTAGRAKPDAGSTSFHTSANDRPAQKPEGRAPSRAAFDPRMVVARYVEARGTCVSSAVKYDENGLSSLIAGMARKSFGIPDDQQVLLVVSFRESGFLLPGLDGFAVCASGLYLGKAYGSKHERFQQFLPWADVARASIVVKPVINGNWTDGHWHYLWIGERGFFVLRPNLTRWTEDLLNAIKDAIPTT